MKIKDNVNAIQYDLNTNLAELLKQHHIKNLRLTSFGSSISSGYSMVRTVKPLLFRNETLPLCMNTHGIHLDVHHFARAQNNNDEHLFEWLITNMKESEIHRLNRSDYSGGLTSMTTHGLTDELLDEYYPTEIKDDRGLQDIILETDSDMANIVIYNGCTGSFLDGVTRKGKFIQKLTYGINRDVCSLEAILKFIQTNNRIHHSNTQVYICGAPDFLGLKITEIINTKLKKIAKKYANTVYVKPVKSKFFYRSLETTKTSFQPDIHYDELEYLQFNNHIITSIIDHYSIINSMIDLDRKLYDFSTTIETQYPELRNKPELIEKNIITILMDESSRIEENTNQLKFYKKSKEYLMNRTPYDFYYIGKDNIQKVLDKKIIK